MMYILLLYSATPLGPSICKPRGKLYVKGCLRLRIGMSWADMYIDLPPSIEIMIRTRVTDLFESCKTE